jgi:hypothetical protein
MVNGKVFVVATMYDVAVAINIYSEIFETTRTGTEQAILDFYHSIVKQKNSWYLKSLTEEYNATTTQKASSDTIRIKLDRLAQIGYVNIERDEDDKRLNVYKPLHQELNAQSMFESHRKTQTQQVSSIDSQLTLPVVPSDSSGSSLLESNGDIKGYEQRNQTAYVSHVKTAEPCFNSCGLASEWQVEIEPDLKQCFCNGCFNKAKRDLEQSGFKVEFKEAGQQ